MGTLIYSAITSLDGYIEDENAAFGWAEPDAEVHAFVNDLQRPVATYLYGRRLYETMVAWETMPIQGQPPYIRDFAQIWRSAEKLVYSSTLESVASARTRIERSFDADAVRELKAERDLAVGGAELAAQAFGAGLVDEVQLFVAPIIVGGGKRLRGDTIRVKLELLGERHFGNGTVYLRYRTGAP